MRKLDMEVVRLLINDELYELSESDRNTIFDSIYHLMCDVEIDDIWEQRLINTDKSLERYVYDGVVNFMKERNLIANELWNFEDDCKIFDFIHECQ